MGEPFGDGEKTRMRRPWGVLCGWGNGLRQQEEKLLQGLRVQRFQDVMGALDLVVACDAQDAFAFVFGFTFLGVAELVAAAYAASLPLICCLGGEA